MDFIFLLEEGDRVAFLHQLMQSFKCTYICVWSYLPSPCNYFIALDGLFQGENNVARRLFEEYRHSQPVAIDSRVPGFAFRNNLPYLELQFDDLQTLASTPVQLQFYREAGIKTAILMGCTTGEIELGMSTNPQVNMEMEMRMLFSYESNPPIKPTSSSTSLTSLLSLDSQSEYTSLLFNLPTTSTTTTTYNNAPLNDQLSRQIEPVSEHPVAPRTGVGPGLSSIRSTIQFPFSSSSSSIMQSNELVDNVIARAYLAIISSSASSSSSHRESSFAPNFQKATAFRRYNFAMPPRAAVIRRQLQGNNNNMFKRCTTFFGNLHSLRRQGLIHGGATSISGGGPSPSSTQVHHVISERRRREKLNESFQQLRSLLPPATKKDKASVLSNTAEYLASLQAQVEELTKKNQILEAQLSLPRPPPKKEEASATTAREEGSAAYASFSSGERVNVRITNVEESTSEEEEANNRRIVELQVRGESSNNNNNNNSNISELVIGLLEFLKGVENVGLISIEANTTMIQPITSSVNHHLILRLKIQGGEWDETAFLEAIKRVVRDLAK